MKRLDKISFGNGCHVPLFLLVLRVRLGGDQDQFLNTVMKLSKVKRNHHKMDTV